MMLKHVSDIGVVGGDPWLVCRHASINEKFNAYISSLDKVLQVFFTVWYSQQLMVMYLVRDGI